ncbi:hypothetical protein, partial [Haliangium sp. UPWRP_2]|uniref:hypothetical protein n=1 Tax=Haliangium sp. UPWRP_2 TaxID=1931276 RepID=UPI001304C623
WLVGLLRRVTALIDGEQGKVAVPTEDFPTAPAPKTTVLAPESGTTDPDETLDDETALARMLASEDNNRDGKIVVGWITAQRGRKAGLLRFITGGKGYGPQDRRSTGDGVMYASTAKPPTAEDREIAKGILDGTIQASAAIRKHKPGGWIERQMGITDAAIVSKQETWKEGLYAQVAGTKWVLFSSDTKPIPLKSGQTATQLLDSLPIVPATDKANKKVA